MSIYYDSSSLLTVLLNEAGQGMIISLWEADCQRNASILLEAEAVVALRRVARISGLTTDSPCMKARLQELETYLAGVVLRDVDHAVISVLRNTPELANCRSSDALHLATAILFQQQLGEPLRICSLDQRMREQAARLKFKVVPE